MHVSSVLNPFAIVALGAALAFATVTGQEKETSKAPASKAAGKKAAGKKTGAEPAGDKVKGEEIYTVNCAICHYADKSEKRIGPGLLGLFKKEKMENGKPVNDANVREIILEGYEKMIPFREKLDAQQLDDLLAYLRTL